MGNAVDMCEGSQKTADELRVLQGQVSDDLNTKLHAMQSAYDALLAS